MKDYDFLKTVRLFVEFDPEELVLLGDVLTETSFAPGAILLEEGSTNRALHIVRSGRIRVSRRVGDQEVALSDILPGETFGEMSIIDSGVTSATLTAITDSEVLSISIGDLATFLGRSPAAAAKFWRGISTELRRRLLHTNDVVRTYFELNQEIIDNPTLRQAYAMCNR